MRNFAPAFGFAITVASTALFAACAPAIRGSSLVTGNNAQDATRTPAEARALAPASERCGGSAADPKLYFDLPFGTEATFNPATQILNEGFDYWQLAGQDKRINSINYAGALRMIGRSVQHPVRAIEHYGTSAWFREEIFPIGKTGAWIPNYQLHVLGSGMQSARMTEWFRSNGVPFPRIASAATMMTSHVLNEVVELRTDYGYSAASMTDLLLFDMGGIALFQSGAAQRFACRLHMTSWQGTPSYNPRTREVENAQQYFTARWSTSDDARWSAIGYMGLGNLIGVRRSVQDGRAVSLAAGVTGGEKIVVDSVADLTTVSLHPQVGLFVDRANSLLVSAVYSPGRTRGLELSIYPGVIGTRAFSPSLWLHVPTRGRPTFGIALGGLPGVSW